MNRLITITLVFNVLAVCLIANAQERINVSGFGLNPNTRQNAVEFVKKALEECKKYKRSELYFPLGRYDFYPVISENSVDIVNENAPVTNGINLSHQHGLIINGGGSEFIFHGKMKIMNIDSCSDITLKNFTADWERPVLSQGEIVNLTDAFVDIRIDKIAYPYLIENGKLVFIGDGWRVRGSDMFFNLYDKNKKDILYKTSDEDMGNVPSRKVEEIDEGILRFYGQPKIKPELGTIALFAMYARKYLPNGIEAFNSKNILLKDLTVHHALCMTLVFVRCENVTLDNANVKSNTSKGRVFSAVADACNFGNCKGLIKVEHCEHTGQGDDFMNISGAFVGIKKRIDNYTFMVTDRGNCFGPGDEVWYINPKNLQRGKTARLKSVVPRDAKNSEYMMTFTEKQPVELAEGVYIENKSWSAKLEFRHNDIGRTNRARGILIQTPQRAIVENNYFHTAGSAILMEGDIVIYYGGPANRDVIIRNNIFDNCVTSGWNTAIIASAPYLKPAGEEDLPYHRNVLIEKNVFKTFDVPLFRGVATEGIYFKNNEIIQTFDYKPFSRQKSAFFLDGCRDIVISGNKIDPFFKDRSVEVQHMKLSEVKIGEGQGFKTSGK
jgi:hypothetical protein